MTIVLFIVTLAIAYLVPGPDMMLILQTGALRGRVEAFATVIGLAMARAAHVALAGLGLAALLRAAPLAFDVVRLSGAIYLAWIGFCLIKDGGGLSSGEHPAAARISSGLGRAVGRGFLTNIANPKALLFCSVLLPQFVGPHSGSVAVQFIALGAILVTIGAAFDLSYAAVGATLGSVVRRRPSLRRLQAWLFGSALIGFGLRLALAGLPE